MDQPLAPNSPTTIALDAIVAGLDRVEQKMRQLEAERTRLLADAFDLAAIESEEVRGVGETETPVGRRGELALRAIRAEVAAVLHLSERTVDRHLDHAFTLTQQFPAVFQALRSGDISARHASVIVDAGSVIGSAGDASTRIARGEYAEEALQLAGELTPAGLAARAKQLAERYTERSLEDRHAEARRLRRVWVEEREDGMAELRAHLPAVEAHAIKDRLTRISRCVADSEAVTAFGTARTVTASTGSRTPAGPGSRSHPVPRRSRDEIRADALADLLLKGIVADGTRGAVEAGGADAFAPSESDGIRAVVQVIVPAESLDSTTDEPPELIGYGPIPASVAKELAASADHWERILMDRTSGEILTVDRYRPSERMRRILRARDRHCRFPGCRVPAHRCDADHTVDAALGGATSLSNLALLCRGHHTLKHHTGWSVVQRARGELEWTAPTGRVHRTRPPGRSVSPVRFTSVANGSESPPDAPF